MGSCNYDIGIIGSGPGGYVAAIRAAQLGLSVVLVEKDKIGGVCLNRGCIPTKSLIHFAKLFDNIKSLGIKLEENLFNYEKIFTETRKEVDTLTKGIQYLLKKNRVDIIYDEGRIKSTNEIEISNGKTIYCKNIVIASGSRAKELPQLPFDHRDILSSDDLLFSQTLPKSLIIIGGGAIGVEFSYIMNSFSVSVTLVEMMDRILPQEDEEISEIIKKNFKKKGISVFTSAKIISVSKVNNSVEITIEIGEKERKKLTSEKVLVVCGRTPNTENIGLDKVNLPTSGFIEVGEYYQTKVKGIYAIGDVVNTPLLAHVASKEGEIVAEHIAGLQTLPNIEKESIPSAIYCEPQIGSFGLTERQAKEKGIDYKKSVYPFKANGKAVVCKETEGIVKILTTADKDKILGAHIIGPNASELIHEILVIKNAGLSISKIINTIHAHPTLSEAIVEASRNLEGLAIHL